MNSKFTASLASFIFAVIFTASGQDEMFKVLISKGANKVTPAKSAPTNLTIGKKLYKTDKITIGANGYVGLAHSCGKTIEMKTAGMYEVSKLSAEVAAQNKGICKKYVDFVVGEMTSQEEDMAKNKYKYMAVTGSVERGGKVLNYMNLRDGNTYAINGPLTLSWMPDTIAGTYVVRLMNLFDEVVFVDTVDSKSITVDLNKYNFKEEKGLVWKIENINQEGETESIGRIISMPDEKESELAKEIAEVKSELGEETALNKFIMANVFAKKELHIHAVANFEAAINMAPDVEDFKIAYNEYLVEKNLLKRK